MAVVFFLNVDDSAILVFLEVKIFWGRKSKTKCEKKKGVRRSSSQTISRLFLQIGEARKGD